MLPMVTFIATLVAIYASGYMHGDRSYWRFFACVSLFVFSMTMLVLVSNFLLLFVFWEAVGLCSYLLIGFWYEKPEAAAAGKKAFLVNRVGDFGGSTTARGISMTRIRSRESSASSDSREHSRTWEAASPRRSASC